MRTRKDKMPTLKIKEDYPVCLILMEFFNKYKFTYAQVMQVFSEVEYFYNKGIQDEIKKLRKKRL